MNLKEESNIMEFIVKSTSIAHGVSGTIPPPKGRCGCIAIGTRHSRPSGITLMEENNIFM